MSDQGAADTRGLPVPQRGSPASRGGSTGPQGARSLSTYRGGSAGPQGARISPGRQVAPNPPTAQDGLTRQKCARGSPAPQDRSTRRQDIRSSQTPQGGSPGGQVARGLPAPQGGRQVAHLPTTRTQKGSQTSKGGDVTRQQTSSHRPEGGLIQFGIDMRFIAADKSKVPYPEPEDFLNNLIKNHNTDVHQRHPRMHSSGISDAQLDLSTWDAYCHDEYFGAWPAHIPKKSLVKCKLFYLIT
jgi:hypothetical protein